jgi:DNA polymerase III delta subunit
VRHVVWVLRAEGVAVLAILGSLVAQLRRLFSGDSRGMPPQRERAMRAAKERLRANDIEALLEQAARVDQQVKGAADGDAWRSLEAIALRVAGVTDLKWIASADQRAAKRAWSGSK